VAAFEPIYGDARSRLRVNLHPGVAHDATPAMQDNCATSLKD
jgi:hypothetical protein